MNRVQKTLHDFFFKPTSPASVCVFRIACGLGLMLTYAFLAPDLLMMFGTHGVMSAAIAKHWHGCRHFSLLFMLPQSDWAVMALFAVGVAAAAGVISGTFTRTSLILSFLCIVSFEQRNPAIWHGGDMYLRTAIFLLIFAPCGRMYSVDAGRARHSNRFVSAPLEFPWVQRLLQFELMSFYACACLTKFFGDTWMDGTAVYYATHLTDFTRFQVPFLLDNLWTIKALTYGTLVIEACLFSLIWFKPLRYPILVMGILLHAGIEWTMNIPVFEFSMVISYLNFIDAKHIEQMASWISSRMAIALAAAALQAEKMNRGMKCRGYI